MLIPAPAISSNVTSTRRQALRSALAGCAGCLLAGCGGRTGGTQEPAVGVSADFVPGPVDAGPIADFARDGIFDRFAMQGFFVVRRGTLVFAMSSVCTHQPVVLHAGQSDLGCPRHGSVFSADGIVLKAPARRALRRYAVRLDDRAHLIVDTSVDFDEAGWKRPGAFLTTPPV